MTVHSTTGPTSVFEGGRLKPGIYKIQNIQSETFRYIDVHTREACCRPAKDLGGLYAADALVFLSDDYKWEIKHLGARCTVKFVSALAVRDLSTLTG